MHPYSTDSHERKYVPLILVSASIVLALVFPEFMKALSWTPPWWIDIPSVVGFYGLLYFMFDRYFWKLNVLRSIQLVRVPDLNGIWRGNFASSHNEHANQSPVTISIKQTWSSFCISLEANTSKSWSYVGGIMVNTANGVELSYLYLNEPRPVAPSAMHIHHGTTLLTFLTASDELDGCYYTGRGRGTHGSLRVKRETD